MTNLSLFKMHPKSMIPIFILSLSLSFNLDAIAVSSPCPEGWYHAQQFGCYHFVRETGDTSWIGALGTCEQLGGILAEPKSAEEMQILTGLALAEGVISGDFSWWIGANDLGHEGLWEWISTFTEVDEFYWSSGTPNMESGNLDDCVMLVPEDTSFKWKDAVCNAGDGAHPICHRPVLDPPTTASSPTTTRVPSTTMGPSTTTLPSTCPAEWLEYDSKCYKFHYSTKSWTDSESFCQGEGGHLASFHSQEENDVMFVIGGSGDAWLGATDESVEDTWIWNDGTPMDWDNWAEGERRNDTSQNCLVTNKNVGYPYGWQWADWDCNELANFVCKITLA